MEKYTGFSGRASLAAMGLWMKTQRIWEEIEARVKIRQKVLQHTPTDKLKDVLITILAGGHGLVEANTRVRVDKALQLAFGRQGCAEQSTLSATLDASTPANVTELAAALQQIYRQHSAGYRHDYARGYQVLDIDLSALVAGGQAEGATKGYFAGHKNRRGRQLGRVVASRYGEIVYEKLYPGVVQLEKNLPELIQGAEAVLDLDAARRAHTLLRVDAGGGTDANINFWLARGYLGLVKVKSWQRICKLVESVTHWVPLPDRPDYAVGWVEAPHAYVRPTRQVALRWPNVAKGGWKYSVIVFNLAATDVLALAQLPQPAQVTDLALLTAVVTAYDGRGGGVETSYKNSKQGLGVNQRNKKRFAAQELLVLLAQLAYNLVHWVQHDLAAQTDVLADFGTLRMVRDAFHIPGKLEFDPEGRLVAITLNHMHKLATAFCTYWRAQFAQSQMCFSLGEI
jgi:hypothetical protein